MAPGSRGGVEAALGERGKGRDLVWRPLPLVVRRGSASQFQVY
jgi:hypothetical protein